MLYPLTFRPIFKERIWGGRNLERLYGKDLPPGVPIGESWEICDRPGDINVVSNGVLAGKSLHWVLQEHGTDLVGAARLEDGRFPLLIKILDAHQKLSLQVHPPATRAPELGGQPKTEMWYFTEAAPEAEIYVGLRRAVTRGEFETRLQAGQVEDCFHRAKIGRGDAMFLPSGRVHALGAGLVLFEIQQNSDTTYRVFDWNRAGLDGKPRQLHVEESLACIDFDDFEPAVIAGQGTVTEHFRCRTLVDDPLFRVDELVFATRDVMLFGQSEMRIFGLVEGRVTIAAKSGSVTLNKGQFCLLPAVLGAELYPEPRSELLLVQTGGQPR